MTRRIHFLHRAAPLADDDAELPFEQDLAAYDCGVRIGSPPARNELLAFRKYSGSAGTA